MRLLAKKEGSPVVRRCVHLKGYIKRQFLLEASYKKRGEVIQCGLVNIVGAEVQICKLCPPPIFVWYLLALCPDADEGVIHLACGIDPWKTQHLTASEERSWTRHEPGWLSGIAKFPEINFCAQSDANIQFCVKRALPSNTEVDYIKR
uniref:Uncharacterized protein n=1 Tax=Timema poppense TaxID=170557 RepID=A0A7R9D195_TIMPO|nr:unnamed protein product [Timema poppensis]